MIKSVITNFPLHDVETKENPQNLSAANGHAKSLSLYGMPMNTYTKLPHPPPPLWELPMPLHTAGRFDPSTVGSIPHDVPPKSAPGTTKMLEPSSYMCRSSEHIIGPSGYYTSPSTIGYVEQNIDFYKQPTYQPSTNVSLASIAPQGHGMILLTHGYDPFLAQKVKKI